MPCVMSSYVSWNEFDPVGLVDPVDMVLDETNSSSFGHHSCPVSLVQTARDKIDSSYDETSETC